MIKILALMIAIHPLLDSYVSSIRGCRFMQDSLGSFGFDPHYRLGDTYTECD